MEFHTANGCAGADSHAEFVSNAIKWLCGKFLLLMQAALTWLTTPIIQRYLFTTPRFRFIYICTYVNMFAGLYVCKVSTFLVTLLFGSLLRVARVFSGFHHYSPYVLCFPLLHWIFVKFFCWFCKIHTNKIYLWHSINGQKQLLKWWKIFVRIKKHTHTLNHIYGITKSAVLPLKPQHNNQFLVIT